MRVLPAYVICFVLVVAVRSEEPTNYFGRRLEPVEATADQETISYLLPRLASKYRPNSQWSGVTDPRFYVLTEMDSNNVDNQVMTIHLRKYLYRNVFAVWLIDEKGNMQIKIKSAEIYESLPSRVQSRTKVMSCWTLLMRETVPKYLQRGPFIRILIFQIIDSLLLRKFAKLLNGWLPFALNYSRTAITSGYTGSSYQLRYFKRNINISFRFSIPCWKSTWL